MPSTKLAIALVAISRVAHADEKVTIGGYLETYYQLNLRLPSNRITSLRGFDSHDRTFTLSNVALDTKAERGPLVARIIVQFGATPAAYYAADPDGELWRYIQQATLAYAAPHELLVEAGLFPSPIGPEVIPIKDNANWSRSNLFFGLPFYHTGARVSKPIGSGWTATLHAYTGWNSVVDNDTAPSVAISASYAGDRLTGQLLYFGGVERETAWRHLFDAYATFSVSEKASVMGQFDAGLESNDFGTSRWVAFAGYGKVVLAPTVYAAVRGDYFREHVAEGAGAIFWPTAWVASGTATLAMQPTDGLSLRFEYRHDHAKDEVFFGHDVEGDGTMTPYVPDRRAQDTITVGAVAWF